jgi:hypothetical protein
MGRHASPIERNLAIDHFIGVDLGKLTDPTALVVTTRSLSVDSLTGLPERSTRGEAIYRWECRAIKRYKLGTAYLSIVADVVRICRRPELHPGLRLVLDATGVGVAVTEMFTRALINFPEIECHTVSITAGEGFSAVTTLARSNMVARGQWRVSKIQLIAAIREVLENRRFKITPDPETGKPVEFAEVLIRELTNFRERITESANMTYEARQGTHDDLVLATCLPIWLGSQRFCHMNTAARPDQAADWMRPCETTALDVEQAALELERVANEKQEQKRQIDSRKESWEAAERSEEEYARNPMDDHWWT